MLKRFVFLVDLTGVFHAVLHSRQEHLKCHIRQFLCKKVSICTDTTWETSSFLKHTFVEVKSNKKMKVYIKKDPRYSCWVVLSLAKVGELVVSRPRVDDWLNAVLSYLRAPCDGYVREERADFTIGHVRSEERGEDKARGIPRTGRSAEGVKPVDMRP